MNDIELKLFPASYGDSFLITCKGKENTNIIIDMGLISTYDNSIKRQLEIIHERGEKISLSIFTHVHEDHILGGIKFLGENGNSNDFNIVKLDEIWFNSFRHLQYEKRQKLKIQRIDMLTSILKKISERGHAREKGVRTISEISFPQGTTLASLLYKNDYKYKWNKSYQDEAIVEKTMIENDREILNYVYINKEVKITVLSPSKSNLENLDKEWKNALSRLGYDDIIEDSELMDDALEVYMASLQVTNGKRSVTTASYCDDNIESIANMNFESDQSVVNGSSIAFILEFYDKRLLFLGDAHAETIENNLKKFMEERDLDRVHFDAVKISHHGSKHNTSMNLLNMIQADRFIISTNGKGRGNCHPDIECIYRIIASNQNSKKEIIFNYKPEHIFSRLDKENLKIKYKYCIKFGNELIDENEITQICI